MIDCKRAAGLRTGKRGICLKGADSMIARLLLRTLHTIVNLILVMFLMLSGTYAVYALWDNNQIISAAEDVRADMIKMKPVIDENSPEPESGETFAQLLRVNPDVCGWICMDNTKIDHPILHGENNLSYINTDVYGNFALAGSIFLDSRNDRNFEEAYSLLYGHHMTDGAMFGDLDQYKDDAFFRENRTGMLILPETVYDLKIIACLLVRASDDMIFEPNAVQHNIQALLDYAEEKALHLNGDVLAVARQMVNPQILALSTCSSEFTEARTIVLTVMAERTADKTGGEENGEKP